MKRSLLLIGVAVILLAGTALALMPPHVTRTDPADGGVLIGDTVIIHGYSLQYVDMGKELKIADAKSKKKVVFTHETTCKDEGDCGEDSKPGACQQKCEIQVKLKGTRKGRKYTLKLLDIGITFTLAK